MFYKSLKINEMYAISKNKLKRKLSVLTRRKLVEYWLAGIKDERRIRQEYGVDKRMLQQLNCWYRKMKEKQYTPSEIHLKKPRKMISEKKAMQDRIKALERENATLKKQLDWAELKSYTYETMIKIAEDDFEIPLRKKLGAKQFKK